ncbi:phage tail protein [Providencia rettgeri]|uniref:phage tail-collar fiber domain-containing protein n=1 Tax=Providencia rettgeri TaxID=587 RepID=UPI001B362F30|nr:phage tail protein [Providencia rettgeri]MBQ0315792.1 phage tail protein [Providencia rettgeri]MBQ0324297.1 phage tail protein [Providencia rettgeri]
MKYFALLTKLGENLLAQATALGTKLELTHMAVGDGGGKLPTPDTNQTKLIAEKRRAAINTLFIDDKNKNQIIAEQIIPEQDGGWWIREIGLFDKAGNLIAVANCPETYKPQLAEGSGRTQSIRMVLIVSHTESVTLKIDPSVVLATREYVNTEITVLDKKIDALSAQTKLDLNKKFDKANISGQKGNDNDRVPSLNLFTTEIGKLAVIGYSYSKIESDGRYQPKGNYAPAGDYATNTALNNGLNSKMDARFMNTGVGNDVTWKGQHAFTQVGIGEVGMGGKRMWLTLDGLSMNPTGNSFYNVKWPERAGNLMLHGDFGVGSQSVYSSIDKTRPTANGFRTYDASLTNTINKNLIGVTLSWAANGAGRAVKVLACEGGSAAYPNWYSLSYTSSETVPFTQMFYTTANAKTDRNGHLKVSGISEELSDYPVGAPIPWPQATAPSGFLVCNGQSFNKTTYPLLAKAYPTGVLPDLRGEFLRGLDAGRNIDSGRVVLSNQVHSYQQHTHDIKLNGASGNGGLETRAMRTLGQNLGTLNFMTENSGSSGETRPRNIAFLYIVRAA